MQITFKNDILNEIFSIKLPSADKIASSAVPETLPSVYTAFDGRVVLMKYSGSLSLANMGAFKTVLFDTLAGEVEQVIIGLENVPEISRSALGVLVDYAAAVLGRGKHLYLLSPPASLLETLDELQLNMFFEVLSTHNDMLCILPDE